MSEATHKQRLLDYFDGLGFERWSAIYGAADVSRIRRTIREGHATMLETAQDWLAELPGDAPRVLDAGCGTGLLSVALARRGARVTAVDIAPQMAGATRQAAEQAGVAERVTVQAGDLEAIEGEFDAVVCLDVLVHYPAEGFGRIARKLAGLSRGPLLFTFAPRTPLLAGLHWLGGRFPTHHRRTEIQMIPERLIHETLAAQGMARRRSRAINHGFYHVTLVEAGR